MGNKIDINKAKGIHDTLDSSEIKKINKIIQSPDIADFLHEVTSYSKKTRDRIFAIIIAIIVIIIAITYYFSGYHGFMSGLVSAIILFTWNGYYHFSRVTDLVHKNIFHILAKSIDANLDYIYEGPQLFIEDESILMKYGFLNPYSLLDSCNHQIQLKTQENEKFSMQGYELETSVGRSGPSKTTNQHYILKVQIPLEKLHNTILLFPTQKKDIFFSSSHSKSCKTIYEDEPLNKILLSVLILIALSLCTISIYYGDGWIQYLIIIAIFSTIISLIFCVMKIKNQPKKMRLYIGNTDFDSYYKSYGSDINILDTFLTPKIIEGLNTIAKKFGNKYSFMFFHDTIYIKREVSRINYLKINIGPNMNKNLSEITRFYTDIKEIYTVGHEMNRIFK